MRYFEVLKTVTAGAAIVVGVVMLTLPGRPGPLTPWIVIGFGVAIAVADLLEDHADRKADREDGDQR